MPNATVWMALINQEFNDEVNMEKECGFKVTKWKQYFGHTGVLKCGFVFSSKFLVDLDSLF